MSVFVQVVLVVLAILFFVMISWVILSPIISALTRIADVMEQFDVTVEEVDKNDG
jgi:hypothetical protein